MRCAFCTCPETRVIDSRLISGGDQIRRRRECTQCKGRFTTHEAAELNLPRIVKSDKRREPFDEKKLRAGILRAIEKRPISMDRIDNAISDIVRKLRAGSEREVKSGQLGDWVMQQLRTIDRIAYIRFASVYRDFDDIHTFLEEIKRLENELPLALKKHQLNLFDADGDES